MFNKADVCYNNINGYNKYNTKIYVSCVSGKIHETNIFRKKILMANYIIFIIVLPCYIYHNIYFGIYYNRSFLLLATPFFLFRTRHHSNSLPLPKRKKCLTWFGKEVDERVGLAALVQLRQLRATVEAQVVYAEATLTANGGVEQGTLGNGGRPDGNWVKKQWQEWWNAL